MWHSIPVTLATCDFHGLWLSNITIRDIQRLWHSQPVTFRPDTVIAIYMCDLNILKLSFFFFSDPFLILNQSFVLHSRREKKVLDGRFEPRNIVNSNSLHLWVLQWSPYLIFPSFSTFDQFSTGIHHPTVFSNCMLQSCFYLFLCTSLPCFCFK